MPLYEYISQKNDSRARVILSAFCRTEEAFNFRSSHPRTTDRIERAIHLAENGGATSSRIERGRFLDHVDNMLFGDNPKQES